MSEQYIQSQYLMNQITNDFFKDKDNSMVFKRFSKHDDYIINSDQESDSSDDESKQVQEEHYSYLDENKEELSTIFDVCDNEVDILKKYTVYVCGYSIQQYNEMPYVQYLFVQENGNYDLPYFAFQCSTNISVDESEEMSPKQVVFQNECMKHILKFIEPLEETNDESVPFHPQFQGFIQSDVQEDTIYAFMNIDHFHAKKGVFGVMDEIVNKHSILNIPISAHVFQLFYNYPSLIHIKNQWGNQVELPNLLYKCIFEDNDYKNVQETNEDIISIIDDRIEHPILGNSFIFSCEPIDESNNSSIKRYLGFLSDPLYLTKSLDSFESDESFALGSVIPSIVDYSKSFFSKKDDESKDEQEETEDDKEEEETEDDEKEEETEDDEKEEETEDDEKEEETEDDKEDDEEDETEDDEEAETEDDKEDDEEDETEDDEEAETEDDEEAETEDDEEAETEDETEDDEKVILSKTEQKEYLLDLMEQHSGCVFFPIKQNSKTISAWSIRNSNYFTEL